MVQSWRGYVIVVLLVLISSVFNVSTFEDVSNPSKVGITGLKFMKLLKTIANVNEDRLNSMKVFNKLQNYNFGSGILRLADKKTNPPVVAVVLGNDNNIDAADGILKKLYNRNESPTKKSEKSIVKYFKDIYRNDDASDRKDGLSINDGDIIENLPSAEVKSLGGIVKDKKKDGDENDSDTNSGSDKNDMLRRWKSCNRKAKKACRKACKDTYKNVCDSYKCSKSMKRSFKRHCKSNCRDRFDD